MKKIIFLFVAIIMFQVFIFHTYAFTPYAGGYPCSSYTNKESDGSTDRYIYYNDLILNTISCNVTMTQNDDYYTFSIVQKTDNNYAGNYGPVSIDNSIYKFDECYIGRYSNANNFIWRLNESASGRTIYSSISMSIGSTELYYLSTAGDETIYDTYYYGGKLYKRTGEIKNIVGPRFSMSSTIGYQYANTYNLSRIYTTINSTIVIKKDEIDLFRYFMPLNYNLCYCNIPSRYGMYNFYAASLDKVIDLKSYINCNHVWVAKNKIDYNHHTSYCELCKWNSKAPHNFLYSYDGIENNRCICGCNKNIKIKISDNINQYFDEYIATPGEALKKIELQKEGYFYNDIYDTEVCYDDNLNLYSENANFVDALPVVTPENSHRYIINYSPHKYVVNYMKDNVYNFDISNTMESQVINYGEKTLLKKSLYDVKGFSFDGWACKPDIGTVIFNDESEVYNLSSNDMDEINLYPVFSQQKYTVHYACDSDHTGYMSDQKLTYGIESCLKSFEYNINEKDRFVCWTYNGIDIDPAVSTNIEKYVNKDNLYIVLKAKIHFYHESHDGYQTPPDGLLVDSDILNGTNLSILNNAILGDEIKIENIENQRIKFKTKKENVDDENEKLTDVLEDKKDYGVVFYIATKSNISGKGGSVNKNDGLHILNHDNSFYTFDNILNAFTISINMIFKMMALFSFVSSVTFGVFILKNKVFA